MTNNFQLEMKNTIFTNLKLCELFSRNDIFRIIKTKEFNDYEASCKKKCTLRGKLVNITKKLKKDVLEVKYSRKLPFGRVYGAKCQTYQFIMSTIKNSLCKDKYMDIDIANAHYTILYNLCKMRKIKTPFIKKYVFNRDEIIEQYATQFEVSKKKIKKMFNSILYCFNDGSDIKIPENIDYIDGLKQEIHNISLAISNDNDTMKKKIKTHKKGEDYDELRTLLSFYIQEHENRILEVMYKYLLNKGYINNVATLFFDGIMIIKDERINESLLVEIEKDIKKTLGIKLILVIKPMNNKLVDFSIMNNVDVNETKHFNIGFMISLPDYPHKKEYFNRFVAKIMFPKCMYVWSDTVDKEKHILNIKELIEILMPIKSGEFKKNGEEITFSKLWLEDGEVKPYRKMDFIPYNKDLEPEIDSGDIFNLFVGYGDHIHTSYTKDKMMKRLKPWIDLVYQLVGAKDDYFHYYISFLSQMIKEPRKKPGVSIVFKSEQGTGKNVHLIPIAQIIRPRHYKSSPNANDFFGEHAEGYYRKLLVNMDEVELKSSYKNEGKMKTAITEDTLTINPKFLRPIEISNHARTIMFSNKDYILPIDVKSGDRRFVVYGPTKKYLKYNTKSWLRLIALFKNPKFISALYDYLMEYDYNGMNWIKDRPITEEYKKLLKQFIPPVALFMNKYILKTEPTIFEIDEDDMDKEEIDRIKEMNARHIEESKEIQIETKDNLYRSFKDYIDENNLCGRDYKPSIKNFENELSGYLGIGMDNINYAINREEVKCFLIAKKYMDCALDEYKYLLEKEVIELDDDDFYSSDDEE